MVEGFAKYSARNFAKKLDKFRNNRVGTVIIRHLVMERAPYDLLKFKITDLQHMPKLNLNFPIAKIFNKTYSLASNLKISRGTLNSQKR